jgi:hypothetical protein
MDYSRLTEEEATDILEKHDEAVWDERLWSEVISPPDVLYWLDAYGDLSLAINCQGLPKDLPSDVVKAINEYDVLNDWDGTVSREECPICNTELFDFSFGHDHRVVDKWGDHHDYLEYLGDSATRCYDTTEEHPFMCQSCSEHTEQDFGRHDGTRGVRIFYGGRSDLYYSFRCCNGIVLRGDYTYDDDCVANNVRNEETDEVFDVEEIERAFAGGRDDKKKLIEGMGYTTIRYDEVDVHKKGMGRAKHDIQEILEDWTTAPYDPNTPENNHPDLPFTYIIEGDKSIYCENQHAHTLLNEIKSTFYRQDGQIEEAKKYAN